MNCESVAERIPGLASRKLSPEDEALCLAHIASCPECSDALRGAEALAEMSSRETSEPPAELFEQIVRTATQDSGATGMPQRFWLGAGFGAAAAASFFAIALALGWFGAPVTNAPEIAEFRVAMHESRNVDIAIESDRPLQGATISIMLAGDIALDGFGGQRELTWAEDLDAGVNRLRLPLVATGADGGQLVVRLSHPQSKRVFVINLPAEA